jgi:phospholipid/cholesterol/gamma-HCH transport system ATP-binding protein
VCKSFNSLVVLDRLDLAVAAGETTVVIGPSGCGKTVLIKHMIGLLRPDRGQVFFKGREISSLPERKMASVRRHMGFLFQGSALFDSMTVAENVSFPLAEHGEGTRDERRARCREVLSLVGLDGLQERFPEELSGGQKKRVALARAIALGPEVIFYDEPTTGLDPVRADLINELILRMHGALGVTSVVVTHDMKCARKVGRRILMLHEGGFIADTTPEGLDDVGDDVVARFVAGRASRKELAELEGGSFLGANAAAGGRRRP